MKFAPVPLDAALGAVVAHTHHLGANTLRKGTRLTAEELGWLREAGRTEVVAAVLEAGDLDEDEAAAQVAAAVTGEGLTATRARTGRSNLHADARGVLEIDVAGVDALNLVDPAITIATRPPGSRVEAGEMAATVKIVPYAVPRDVVERACADLRPLLRVRPFVPQRYAFVASRLPGGSSRLIEQSLAAQKHRVAGVGGVVASERWVAHAPDAVAEALRADADVVLFLGASAIVDLEDVLPAGLRAAGGRVEHLGMPVDPGNLTLLGELDGRVVIGVPGCARSPKRSGFDQVLERIAARIPTVGADLQRMGVGGLLTENPDRPQRRAASPARPRLGAVVLAAGRSSRMGADKLLVDLEGRALVAWAVDALLGAAVGPVVVVTGRSHEGVAAALGDRPVTLVRNPAPEEGMARSLAEGLAALDGGVDGFFVMLGDVPFVRPEDVRALAAAFDPDAICVPEHQRRRGHPVLWARRFRDELAGLTGDVGARAVLDAHADAVRVVQVDNPGISVDIDTPEALAAARARRT